jgi:hypothetical protein
LTYETWAVSKRALAPLAKRTTESVCSSSTKAKARETTLAETTQAKTTEAKAEMGEQATNPS